MITAMRKLILALITTLLGVLSSGAAANTNYDFSYSGSNDYSVTGVFSVDGNGVIQGITGTVSGANPFSGTITGLLPVLTFGGNDNLYYSSAPYLNGDGVSFTTSSGNLNLFSLSPSEYALIPGFSIPSRGTMTSSISSAGVPEIDGALAPKVGFLLSCLFLMFGRKKQDLAPALTA